MDFKLKNSVFQETIRMALKGRATLGQTLIYRQITGEALTTMRLIRIAQFFGYLFNCVLKWRYVEPG